MHIGQYCGNLGKNQSAEYLLNGRMQFSCAVKDMELYANGVLENTHRSLRGDYLNDDICKRKFFRHQKHLDSE